MALPPMGIGGSDGPLWRRTLALSEAREATAGSAPALCAAIGGGADRGISDCHPRAGGGAENK
jgi:hypothetical protein